MTKEAWVYVAALPESAEMLESAGLTVEEVRRYLDAEDGACQLRILRKRRRILLDEIHAKQALIDHIDFIIWNKQKEK